MHPNTVFRRAGDKKALAYLAERGFGQFIAVSEGAPVIAAAPFVMRDGEIEAHFFRANPLLKCLPGQVTLIVTGADAYISPDWYDVPDQVPTWNYVSIHAQGEMRVLPAEEIRDHLDRLSERFEAELAPKPIWQTAKMTPKALESMMRGIVAVRLQIQQLDSTFKLSQNKPDEVRLRAAGGVEKGTPGLDPQVMANMMRSLD